MENSTGLNFIEDDDISDLLLNITKGTINVKYKIIIKYLENVIEC